MLNDKNLYLFFSRPAAEVFCRFFSLSRLRLHKQTNRYFFKLFLKLIKLVLTSHVLKIKEEF